MFVSLRLLVDTLYSRNCDIYLISGGFDTIIEPVAEELGIPIENIFANKLKFFFDGMLPSYLTSFIVIGLCAL